ncbi:MAG: protoporphyrinogen oxidase, partial [Armatimonadetes bacterium]|nr:protoporphyrinogen oxidase [Armatimonadota bacterium]
MSNDPQPTPKHTPRRIVVIGGGITGLAAAHRLVELSNERNLPVDVTLLEASGRLGGGIHSERIEGCLIEEGPDAFITTKPWGLELCRRLGLESELIRTNDAHRTTYVVRKGRLVPIPDGLFMIAPTKFTPFVTSPLFSLPGKLRMGMDLFIPRGPKREDESLASFVTRRLGREALDRVAQPLVSGVYTADPEFLSLRASMPRFLEMEEKYGSVIRAMVAERKATLQKSRSDGKPEARMSGARYSMFVSFREGLKVLVEELQKRLPEGCVRFNQRVTRVEKVGDGWKVHAKGGASFEGDGVVLASPAHVAATMVEGFDASLAQELAGIGYASSAIVHLAYRTEDLRRPLDGFGFVVPAVEKRSIIACSFTSVKFDNRAPEGTALLRCFIGGAIQPEAYERDDVDMLAASRKEMRDLLGITSEPLFYTIHRHPLSMPQYAVGHLNLCDQIEARVSQHAGLAIAGCAFRGVGIPDCVHSGEEAAERLMKP